jgi:hypothetical protein
MAAVLDDPQADAVVAVHGPEGDVSALYGDRGMPGLLYERLALHKGGHAGIYCLLCDP